MQCRAPCVLQLLPPQCQHAVIVRLTPTPSITVFHHKFKPLGRTVTHIVAVNGPSFSPSLSDMQTLSMTTNVKLFCTTESLDCVPSCHPFSCLHFHCHTVTPIVSKPHRCTAVLVTVQLVTFTVLLTHRCLVQSQI